MSEHGSEYKVLTVDEIRPAKDNPRQKVGDVAELAASIKAVGLLEPVVVTPRNGHYLLVAGARRLAGAKKAGKKRVPAIVREMTETERHEAMLIENLQREDLTVLEEARAYDRLVNELGLSQRELAARVGRSQPHISKRLALVDLPADVQKELDSGGITIEDGLSLTKLGDDAAAIKRCLSRADAWGGIPSAVDSELDNARRKKKVDAAVARVKKSGEPYVAARGGNSYSLLLGTGHAEVSTGSWNGVDMAPEKHAKEPCHAVTVHPHDARIVEICTNPGRHKKAGSTPARNGNDPYAKERKQLDEAAAARHEFLRELVGSSKLPKAEIVKMVLSGFVREIIEYAGYGDEVAAELLGLVTDEDQEAAEANAFGGPHLAALILEHAAAGEAQLLRTAFAVLIASKEEGEAMLHHGSASDAARDYFAFLERNGYTLAPIEKKKLGKKAAAR